MESTSTSYYSARERDCSTAQDHLHAIELLTRDGVVRIATNKGFGNAIIEGVLRHLGGSATVSLEAGCFVITKPV